MKTIRALVSLLWAALCSCCLFSCLRVLEAAHRRKGTLDSDDYRNRFTEYQSWFADLILSGVVHGLGLRLKVDTGGLDLSRSSKPFIVVSNHRWIGDPLFVYKGLREAGGWTKVTWVMKRELERTPFGRAAKQMGAAFVSREGAQSGDRALVERAAHWAKEHIFGLLIFLEGTRKKVVRAGSRFRHLLDPKTGGLVLAAEAMPEADFVTISLRWSGDDGDLSPGKTVWEFVQGIALLVGRTITIRVRRTPRAEVGDPAAWAQRTWGEMDEWLEQQKEEPV